MLFKAKTVFMPVIGLDTQKFTKGINYDALFKNSF